MLIAIETFAQSDCVPPGRRYIKVFSLDRIPGQGSEQLGGPSHPENYGTGMSSSTV
jgi:hypothetical protein